MEIRVLKAHEHRYSFCYDTAVFALLLVHFRTETEHKVAAQENSIVSTGSNGRVI